MRSASLSILLVLVLSAPASAAEWRRASLITPPFSEVPTVLTSVSGAGETLVVWEDSNTLIYRTRVRGQDAGAPEQIATDVSRTYTLAADGAGNAVVAWIGSRGGSDSAVHARFRPAGGQFGLTMVVSDVEVQASQLKAALAPSGEAVLAWRDLGAGPGQRRLRMAARPARAEAFEPVRTVATGEPRGGSLGVDDEGNAFLAWTDGGALRVLLRRVGFPIGEPQVLTTPNLEATGDVAMDVAPNGVAILAFLERARGAPATRAHVAGAVGDTDTFFDPAEVLSGPFARDLTVDASLGYGAAAWTAASGRNARVQAAPVTQNSFDPTQTLSARNARRPDIAATASGRFTAVWQRLSDRGRAIEATSRTDRQERFPTPERVSPYGDVLAPDVEVNARGEQFAAWTRSGRGLSRAESAKASSRTGRFTRVLTIFDGRVRVGETVDVVRLEPSGNVMQAVYRRRITRAERLFWDLSTYAEPAP